jgi:hypothetical protein
MEKVNWKVQPDDDNCPYEAVPGFSRVQSKKNGRWYLQNRITGDFVKWLDEDENENENAQPTKRPRPTAWKKKSMFEMELLEVLNRIAEALENSQRNKHYL